MTQRYHTREQIQDALFEVDWMPLLEGIIPDPQERQRMATALSQLRQAIVDGLDLSATAESVEHVYALSDSDTLDDDDKPDNSWGYLSPGTTVGGTVWTSAQQSTSQALPYVWRAERMLDGSPAMGDAVAGLWSDPILIARPGSGLPGPSGVGREEIFAAYEFPNLPESKRPNNSWGYGQGGISDNLRWLPAAPSLTHDHPFLFKSVRQILGAPAIGSAVTALWSVPIVVSLAGIAGEDASAYEYIFTTWTDEDLPAWAYPDDPWGYNQPQSRTNPNP